MKKPTAGVWVNEPYWIFLHYSVNVVLFSCFSVAICDESGSGGVVVSGDALWSLQAHGILPVDSLGVRHHRLQNALPAQRCQPWWVFPQLQLGKRQQKSLHVVAVLC